MTPSETSPGGAKATQKQVQMLQNIEIPRKICDILHLQLVFWGSSPSGSCDASPNKSTKVGSLALLSAPEKLSMRRPDAKYVVSMVDVVRKRQIPAMLGWTAGGYMVTL